MKYHFTIFIFALFFIVSTSFAQLPWTKDANNPVMSGGATGTWNRHVFMPSVLYNPDSARFEMWFGASYGPPNWRPYSIGFGVSDDGVDWTKHPTAILEPDPGEWDESTVEVPMVLRENGEYKMWYTGWSPDNVEGGIGYATSPDGIQWTKDTLNNPVLEPGTAAWEIGGPGGGIVMSIPGGGYKMWYTGYSSQSTAIGYATSPDGITWTRDTLNNPVLEPGPTGEWDDAFIFPANVVLLDNIYHMWYTGSQSSGNPRQVGFATSPNGIDWTKYDDPTTTSPPYSESDPVLKTMPGQWDGNYIEGGSVMLIGDTLNIWYAGGRSPTGTYLWRIGHATSPYTPVAIDEDILSSIPTGFVLSQNYPNPFNPSTTIEFSLPQSGFVTLKIYNILGEEVATLVSERLAAGSYKYDWDAGSLASGVYLYKIQAGEYMDAKKMVLMR